MLEQGSIIVDLFSSIQVWTPVGHEARCFSRGFPLVIRNSSFVVSTILLKLSFAATGIMAQVFIIVGVSFGVAMYAIANLYPQAKLPATSK